MLRVPLAHGTDLVRCRSFTWLVPPVFLPRVTTNSAAQAGLLAIEILEHYADQLPSEAPALRRDETESAAGSRTRRAPRTP